MRHTRPQRVAAKDSADGEGQSRTILFDERDDFRGRFQSAVSLHAHTQCSREDLSFLPLYAARIPVVSLLFRLEMERRRRACEPGVDFKRGYWVPPLTAESVYLSERGRIRRRLGLSALVSITDHDELAGTVGLRKARPCDEIPLSTEWTLPYCGRILHLGLHNLPECEAQALMCDLRRCTQRPADNDVRRILDRLHEYCDTLVVLNHPFCDLVELTAARQRRPVLKFLHAHGDRIHALEVNGYRSWQENRLTLALSRRFGLPAVSGGDRHCLAPNAILNLSQATTFAGFVEEVRYRKTSTVVVMPRYRRSLVAREVEALGDFFRTDGRSAAGGKPWTERVFYRNAHGQERPLAYYWKRVLPLWVKMVLGLTSLTANRTVQTAFRWMSPPNQLSG